MKVTKPLLVRTGAEQTKPGAFAPGSLKVVQKELNETFGSLGRVIVAVCFRVPLAAASQLALAALGEYHRSSIQKGICGADNPMTNFCNCLNLSSACRRACGRRRPGRKARHGYRARR